MAAAASSGAAKLNCVAVCCAADTLSTTCLTRSVVCLQAAEVLRERYPKVDAVFSSDLLRAVQTAEVVAAVYQLQVCRGICLD
jgi:hypothetical protein